MPSLNRAEIIGNLGTDPEMKWSPGGDPSTTFRVATSRTFRDHQKQVKKETEWFTIVTWGALAERCNQYLKKGRLVHVDGRIKTKTWMDKEGVKHYSVEIIANAVIFLDKDSSAAPVAPDGGDETEG